MTRRRWLADEYSDDRAALTGAHAAHLARTLRARVGQEFEVACGDVVRRATVTHIADDRVEFGLGERVSSSDIAPITLLLAIFKFDRMEWAIEKCTELNVTTIVPIVARRTEKHLGQAAEKRVERWQRIAREASGQSRRGLPPEIIAPMKLADALRISKVNKSSSAFEEEEAFQKQATGDWQANEPRRGGTEVGPGREPWVDAPFDALSPVVSAQAQHGDRIFGSAFRDPNHLCIVLAENERAVTLVDVLHAQEAPRSLTLAIGPEGGWAPDELQSFASAQFVACSLGETILRAETAAIAALAIARAEI